ncbi:lysozyme inhibitor LprI family protein [Burkholderia sp. 22PA0106]|uniref:lysozyme inhibitor LprI family protein n=1 Tax=Burkholderia sp. 22PA0106 TaxID=3237371 RepID=UPI0039C0CEAC
MRARHFAAACLMAALTGIGTSAAQAASFDCKAARTGVERSICSQPALGDLDSQLDTTYRQTVARAADPAAVSRSQRAWLAERNRCGDAACIEQAYRDRLGALAAVKSAEWRRYSSAALGIAFDYPSNRKPVTPCPGTGEKRCVALVGRGMDNSDYFVELNVVNGALEAVAQRDALFKQDDNGKWVTSAGPGTPADVERFAGRGWQGMRATQTCGVSDPESGFHAAGGECLWAVLSNGTQAVVADTQGIVGNDDDTARMLGSLQFLH